MQSQMNLTELMDEVLDVYLGGSSPNSDTRSVKVSLVSSIGGNVGEGKVGDDIMISTIMEVGFGDLGNGKDVVCKGGDVGDNGGTTCGAKVSTDV